jgi:hypothetical protein
MCIAEVVETQSVIITMQAKVINGLFGLLSNYMTLEEMDNIPEIGLINEAANLKQSIKDYIPDDDPGTKRRR